MEVATTHIAAEQYREAIPFLKNVISDPVSSLKPKAYLKMGIAYYNLNNDNEALKQYTTVLQQFPNSPEADAALENARIIYVEQGKTSDYVAFARSMGKEITSNQEDELMYQQAEVQFNNGNFPSLQPRNLRNILPVSPMVNLPWKHCTTRVRSIITQKDWTKSSRRI